MALTTQSAWALLNNVQAPKETIMRVTCLRGFWHEKQLIRPGEIVDLPEGLVNELLSSQKIELIQPTEVTSGTATETDSHQVPQDVQSVD